MKMFSVILALFCVASPLAAQIAQTRPSPSAALSPPPVKPPLPEGPLLKSAPDFSEWEVTFTYADDKKKKDPAAKPLSVSLAARLRNRVTTKTGHIFHERETDLTNHVVDIWYDGASKFVKSPDGILWYEFNPGNVAHTVQTGEYNPPPASGFRDMGLAIESNYAGQIAYGNVNCLVFAPGGYQKLDLKNDGERDKRMAEISQIAFVDADSRLPIALRLGSEVRNYRFNAPPTQMQILPADLADQLKKGEAARARLNVTAARPF